MAEPLTPEQWAFYEAHGGVMVTVARRFRDAAPEEDLLDWGGDGLIRAARTWDGRTKPSTWVWHCVRYEILHRLRDRRKRGIPIASLEDHDAFLDTRCANDADAGFAGAETRALIDSLAARATPFQRRMLAAFLATDAQSFGTVATPLGCSKQWVYINLHKLRDLALTLGQTPGETP